MVLTASTELGEELGLLTGGLLEDLSRIRVIEMLNGLILGVGSQVFLLAKFLLFLN